MVSIGKLDGVGPVDNRPFTYNLHHFVQKKTITKNTLQVTCCGGWTFSQNFSYLAFKVCDIWYFEDLEEKDDWLTDWLTEWINDEGVCRTALATPGLLNTRKSSMINFKQTE